MAESHTIELLFKNYLRELYTKIEASDVENLKSRLESLSNNESWCMVNTDVNQTKQILCYYLIQNKCPEYRMFTTIEIVEDRLSDSNVMKGYIDFSGILIIRHSSSFIKNKLVLESLLNIVGERAYKGKTTIVVSDTYRDCLDYVYYDHEKVLRLIGTEVTAFGCKKIEKPASSVGSAKSTPATSGKTSASMRARMMNNTREQKITDRSEVIIKENR